MDKKTEFIDIVKFGIDLIGTNTSITDIKKAFSSDYINYEDVGPQMFPGQETLSLICEQDLYQRLLNFDMLPSKDKLTSNIDSKYLANFRIQIRSKRHSFLKFLKAPLMNMYRDVYIFLSKTYPRDQILNRPDLITKENMDVVSAKITSAYDHFIPRPKEIFINYIVHNNAPYLAVFFHYEGNEETPPFLSFSISDPIP